MFFHEKGTTLPGLSLSDIGNRKWRLKTEKIVENNKDVFLEDLCKAVHEVRKGDGSGLVELLTEIGMTQSVALVASERAQRALSDIAAFGRVCEVVFCGTKVVES